MLHARRAAAEQSGHSCGAPSAMAWAATRWCTRTGRLITSGEDCGDSDSDSGGVYSRLALPWRAREARLSTTQMSTMVVVVVITTMPASSIAIATATGMATIAKKAGETQKMKTRMRSRPHQVKPTAGCPGTGRVAPRAPPLVVVVEATQGIIPLEHWPWALCLLPPASSVPLYVFRSTCGHRCALSHASALHLLPTVPLHAAASLYLLARRQWHLPPSLRPTASPCQPTTHSRL